MSRPLSEKLTLFTLGNGNLEELYKPDDVEQKVKEAYEDLLIQLRHYEMISKDDLDKIFKDKFGFAISEGEEK